MFNFNLYIAKSISRNNISSMNNIILIDPSLSSSNTIMSESPETTASSQASSPPDHNIISIAYELEGHFTIDTPLYLKDLPEIQRRSSVIMATHLFFGTAASWGWLRPYVASNMYIPNLRLLLNAKSYTINGNLEPDEPNCGLVSEVQGCQELVVSNEFIVVIGYKLKIRCSLDQTKGDLKGFKLAPEPHYSWLELIKDVEKAHDEQPIKKFSGALADRAISLDIRFVDCWLFFLCRYCI